jgi:hypothetical protein
MCTFSKKPLFPKTGFLTVMLTIGFRLLCLGQTDTVFANNEKIACSVKEVTPDAVKYTYPGEDVINSIYKNTVQKIIFKSGRVQTFAESSSYKVVANVMDYDKVTITAVESEVRGLYKLGDVSSKAKGTTTFSNQERVKERAYRKFKIQAAMLGANVILLTNQRTEGNKNGYYNSSAAETNLTGIAYSNVVPDLEKFKKLIGTKTDFVVVREYKLWASDSDVSQDDDAKPIKITNIVNNNGIIYIEGNLQGERDVHQFQLAGFNNDNFYIQYKAGSTDYNLMVSF